NLKPSELKREMNEQFRLNHPEIPAEITLSKIRAIKLHLLEIGKQVDLEVSSVAHAYVFFEKLVIKHVVTKKNRKLIAACCLFLATKVNEAKGTWFRPLLEAMDDELDVDAEEIHEHEFAVFADLEFNLYVPRREFMPHFERI
ncbi:cyclin, partial [Mucor lusitanicus CBS 277.49]